MAEAKIFAGPRIRRIRTGLGLTQTAMAAALDISPSYLNLIERNQRPLTVQIILKLSATYKIDVAELQGTADAGSVGALKEVFSDPLLEGELPGDTEIVELADGAPNAAAAIVKLHRAYREQQERLSDLSRLLNRQGHETTSSRRRLPSEEVRDTLENHPACFPSLEDGAARILAELKLTGDPGELWPALKSWLKGCHGIGVQLLPVETMPNWRRRFDRHSQRLFLSERLSREDQIEMVAMEVALLAGRQLIDEEVAFLKITGDEAVRLARFELARYVAQAIMMPYDAFLSAGRRARFDIDVLAARFGVSFTHAAGRLTALQRKGREAVPFFLTENDHAGNNIRRRGARGFPSARFGGDCPKLPVHRAFATPGEILVERVITPDDAEFIVIARTLDGPRAASGDKPRRRAVMIGFDCAHSGEVVYGDGDPGLTRRPVTIGPSCRLCERQGCLSRANPPLTRPLALDDTVTGLSAFDFQ